MKNAIISISLIFAFFLSSCDDNSEESDTKPTDPRKSQKPEEAYYSDSVYIISKKIDTVYSQGEWMDLQHLRSKRRKDSLKLLHQSKSN